MIKLQIGDLIVIDRKLAGYTQAIHPDVIVTQTTVDGVSGFMTTATMLDTGTDIEIYFRHIEIMHVKKSRETLACLVSTVQDFIDKRDITIDNPEKDVDGESVHESTIYGSDWDELVEGFESVLNESGVNFRETF